MKFFQDIENFKHPYTFTGYLKLCTKYFK